MGNHRSDIRYEILYQCLERPFAYIYRFMLRAFVNRLSLVQIQNGGNMRTRIRVLRLPPTYSNSSTLFCACALAVGTIWERGQSQNATPVSVYRNHVHTNPVIWFVGYFRGSVAAIWNNVRLTVKNDFRSRVRRFAGDFHEGPSHERERERVIGESLHERPKDRYWRWAVHPLIFFTLSYALNTWTQWQQSSRISPLPPRKSFSKLV